MKKSNLIMIVVTISIFVVLLLGATYAYFASNTNTGNGLDMTITTDNNNIAFAATEGALSMHVKAEDMLQSQTGSDPVLAAETVGEDNIVITLSTNTEAPIACTYNVYFQWNTNQTYTKTTGATKELTLELNLNDEDSNGSEGTNSFASEKQITDVVTGTTKTKIVNGAYIVGNSSNSGTQEWIPTVRFYNLAKDQSALAGKTLGGKFTIEDVECNAMENLSDKLTEEAESSTTATGVREYTSSQDGTPYIIKHETVEYEGTTYDAGIRYEGKDPDNYVVFNGEQWRIIGTFEGGTIGLDSGKRYTKIVRNATIDKAWDCSDFNKEAYFCRNSNSTHDWTNSTLNAYLNGEYLNGNGQIIKDDTNTDVRSLYESSKAKIAQYNGNYSTWYLRGITEEQSETAITSDWYLYERVIGSAGYRNGVLGDADTTIQSAIAIMYPSDYGYAAYGESCTSKTPLYDYGTIEDWDTMEISGCPRVDWLFLDNPQWLLSMQSDNPLSAFIVGGDHNGGVYGYTIPEAGFVRPTLYLEYDVMIVGGNGSKANPYKLS